MRASPGVFLQRAGEEARRYGADPWIFVRELVQNARDAGASRVDFSTGSGDGLERICCRDDGDGLDRDAAARFLFTLYASSKSGAGDAGRFGVGFWSILRFDPSRIEVRSVARSGGGFRVVLDSGLQLLEESPAAGPPGTEVTLERPGTGAGLADTLEASARDQVGLVNRKGRGRRRLAVAVDGRLVNRELLLSAPSSRFSGPGFRGVVGLGHYPRVELFACGLKVREAASLDDLLAEGRRPARSRRSAPAAGLAPQVLLDGDRLELLLARGDARDDRELEKLVAGARRELDRLVLRVLDRRMPLPLAGRLAERVARWFAAARARPIAAGVALAGAILLPAALLLGPLASAPPQAPPGTATALADRPLTDLAVFYRGPDVGLTSAPVEPVNLRYVPSDQDLLLAVLRLDGPSLEAPFESGDVVRSPPRPCARACVEIEMTLVAGTGMFRLPVPAGAAVDPVSVRLNADPVELWITTRGEAALRLPSRGRARVLYRAGPPPAEVSARTPSWPSLPPALEAEAARLAELPEAERIEAATAVVRRFVRYDRSAAVVARFRAAEVSGLGVLDRALAVGAGDCDVQNAVLAALLSAAGSPSWLAVGYVGHGGRALPGLHAWAEVEGNDGRRLVADASITVSSGRGTALAETISRPADAVVGPEPAGGPALTVRRDRVAVGLALLVLTALVGWAVRRRVRRRLDLEGPLELAELVRGALEHRDAFAGIAGISSRPLIPCLGGRRLSLARARALAVEGRLLASAEAGELAARVASSGIRVVDAAQPEGAAAASGLAAVDLDWWQAGLGRIAAGGPLDPIDRLLRSQSTGVRLAAVPGLGTAMRCLDLAGLGCGRALMIALDPETLNGVVTGGGAASRPAASALRLLERAFERLDIPRHRCEGPRRAVAAAALREAVDT